MYIKASTTLGKDVARFHIVRMDTLTPQQITMVTEMYYGDETCSLKNMEVSCFASESCNRSGASRTESANVSEIAANTFVTVDDHENVVAFATMIPIKYCGFLNMKNPPTTGMFISNLCVLKDERANGHGRKMLEYLCTQCSGCAYLSVRRPDVRASQEVQTFMKKRCETLLKMYGKLSFYRFDHTNEYYILKRSHDRNNT